MSYSKDSMQNWPGIYFLSSKQSEVITCNLNAAQLCGYKHPKQLEGINYEQFRAPVAELAQIFRDENNETFTTKRPIKFLGYYHYAKKNWRLMLGSKYLLQSDAQPSIGVVCCGLDVTQEKIIDISRFLLESQKKYVLKIYQKQFSVIIQNQNNNEQLSVRELECLFFILRGFTYKTIAKILNLSYRTIEDYCLNIRIKLNCQNRSEVIEKAIVNGYLNMIPESLFNHSFRSF